MGVMKDDVDYSVFTWEGQYYLAQIRGGCPGGEQQALEMTLHNYPHVSESDVRGWAREPVFHRALKDARERGKENLRYDEVMAARRSQDPFGIPPRGGVDLAAVAYDAQAEKPRGGLGGWLRRLGVLADRQAQPELATTPGQRFIPEADMTPQQLQAYRLQEAARRQPEPSRSIFTQKPANWSGKGMADDGSMWAD